MVQNVFQKENIEIEKFSHWKSFFCDLAVFSINGTYMSSGKQAEMDKGTCMHGSLNNPQNYFKNFKR